MPSPAFQLVAPFQPAGDQPQAISRLNEGLRTGKKPLVLMGVTGSGKTFTMANVIESLQRPTLVMSHNKTLAAQLYGEFKEFFPHNAVHYFVSYYDYYQPEAYIPQRDIYIEKDASINQEIEPSAPCRDQRPGQSARRNHRGQRLLYLRSRLARRLPIDDDRPAVGTSGRAGRDPLAAGQHPVRSERRCVRVREVSRARRLY